MAGTPPKPPPPNFAVGSSSPKPPPPISIGRHPSDEELIDSYLRDRVASGTQTQAAKFIHEADLYSADPDLLTSNHAAATSSNGDRAWYFFTPLRLKGSVKDRMKRNVDTGREGSWVGGGETIDVSNGQRLIGRRLGFQFKEKLDGSRVKSATPWRMMEFRLNPDEGRQELDSPDLLVLSKVYRSSRNAKAEGESSMAVANADAEAPAASAAVTPGHEGEADEEIGAEMAAGPAPKKRKAGDKDSGAETVASSPGRKKKAGGEIESADAATTGEIFADSKNPLDAPEQPTVRRVIQFFDFMGVSAPLDATDEAEQEEPRDPRDP